MDAFIDEQNRSSVRAVLMRALLTGEGTPAYDFPLYTKDKRKLTIRLS